MNVKPPEVMRMGKYSGLPLTSLDDSYLCWLVDHVQLAPSLRRSVERELARRRIPLAARRHADEAGGTDWR